MDATIEKILTLWHAHYQNEANRYSEFEDSDIEYFVGCMLYNRFAFSKALPTLKTMDLSYDFLSSCGEREYEEACTLLASLELPNEEAKLAFLQNYIEAARAKYTKNELYLLDRLKYHVDAMAERYAKNIDAQPVDFTNPLLRTQ